MLSNFASWAIAALAAGASVADASSDPFVIRAMGAIAVARIDPIINPGKVAGHVHSLFGASNIRDVLNTPEEQQRATCTSAIVGGDKSSYWAPTLYYIRKDGTYEGMVHGSRAYYFNAPNTTPWPPGMRIVTGTAMSRDLSDHRTGGIVFDINNQLGHYLPNTTSHPSWPGGPRTGIHFPSCGWANQSLDSSDHFSHLTWPINTGGGKIWECIRCDKCPESHPIKYPTMMLEVNYYPSEEQKAEWGTRPEHFAFSNGDTLGPSFHADFVNGWDPKVLGSAVKDCRGVNENLEACPAFVQSGIDVTTANCRIQGMIPDEEVGFWKPIKELPGCNPIWTASMGDSKPTDCPNRLPDPGWTPPNAMWNDHSREGILPLAVPMDPRAETNWTNVKATAGTNSDLTPWGVDNWGRYAKFPNKDAIMIGTAQDIADNLNMDTAVFKRCQVQGMVDSSEFTGMTPPNVVGPEAHMIQPVPSGVATFNPFQDVANGTPLGRPTAVDSGDSNTATPAGNASIAEPTPAPGSNTNNRTDQAANDKPAVESPIGETPAAETPAASPNASAVSSAGSTPSAPASDPVASPAPGGANNLVVDGGAGNGTDASSSSSASSSAAAPASTPASGSGSKPAGGNKKCNKRRRRRSSRLH